MKPARIKLPEDIERDVRALLRRLRAAKHVEAFLVVIASGALRICSVGKDCQRVGRYVVRPCQQWEDLGEIIRGDVLAALREIKQPPRGRE